MTQLISGLARAIVGGIFLLFAANVLPAHAQNTDAVADLAARVNRERISRALPPLVLNAKLTSAAQTHAEDIARSGRTRSAQEGHVGSDGSTVFDRVARTGYGAYSWGRRLGEIWAWYRSSDEAMVWWMDSAPHRASILHQLYREMGIGIAPNSAGGFVYVIDFGSQPNILPIFISDAANETKSLNVKITLTSEEVAPNGDGESIGRPVQVMISNSADFAGAQWQPYAQTINWTLAPNGGMKTVYAKYRDAKGRTAIASDSIVLGATSVPTIIPTRATPMRTATRVAPRPTMNATFVPTESPAEVVSAPSQVAATEIAQTETPIVVPTMLNVTETLTPTQATATSDPLESRAVSSFDGLGSVVAVVMSIVLIRVWSVASH